jgi:CDP-diacylglycerol--glycerol-3-phosphate 3-phosphatidyltransferase
MSSDHDPLLLKVKAEGAAQFAPGEAGAFAKELLTLPNQLTLSRLVLSLVFFAFLIVDDYYFAAGVRDGVRTLMLNISIVVFILAAITDFFDGYLARKQKLVSTFGRLADPIVDKVFICGSFVLLVESCALVKAWIPVVILSREFLISGLRSFLESRGIAFGADIGGKLKMGVQSVTIPVVIFYEANVAGSQVWRWLTIVLLGATIVLTVASSVNYVRRAYRLLRG